MVVIFCLCLDVKQLGILLNMLCFYVISPILIFHLMGLMEFIGEALRLAQFCNLGIGDILGTWDLGEIQNCNLSGM